MFFSFNLLTGNFLLAEINALLFVIWFYCNLSCARTAPVVAGVGYRLRSDAFGLALRTRNCE